MIIWFYKCCFVIDLIVFLNSQQGKTLFKLNDFLYLYFR